MEDLPVSARMAPCLAFLLALVAGCAVSHFDFVARFRPGKGTGPTESPHTGEYVLCRGKEDEVVERRRLRWGHRIGFQQYEDGRLIAWAGEEAIPLDEDEYRWHLLPITSRQRIRNYLGGYQVVVSDNPMVDLFYGTLFRVTVLPIYSLCVNGKLTPS
jgi:hypothetical protein